MLSVEPLCQYPAYPTGCEIVSAAMALSYAGESVSIDTLIDEHLSTSRDWYWYDGVFYGPDPAVTFCGDPRSKASYGCFAPVIRSALLSVLGDENHVIDATGQSLAALCREYIDSGTPIILWATIAMCPVEEGRSWQLPDGRQFCWPAGEHCLLLVGYDEVVYYFNDPTTGKLTAYSRAATEQAYDALGRQALVITA